MHKVRIEVDHNKCVGNGACVAADPAHFSLKDEKAVLPQQKKTGSVVSIEKELSDEQLKDAIDAAKVCPTNAIRVFDVKENVNLVATEVTSSGSKVIIAQYDDAEDFVLDPKGYFLIRILPETKEIEVGFCNMKNKVEVVVRGKKPIDIYHNIAKLELISRMEHASYLGRELQKAFIALQKGIKYVQDDELIL
ncbi:DUF4346 domain-containing protein [Candidatus Woesearchaeota archaeon]|nr:DUF4346 domain-containing protein [Candidatus Woesearchaeota archaeon]